VSNVILGFLLQGLLTLLTYLTFVIIVDQGFFIF